MISSFFFRREPGNFRKIPVLFFFVLGMAVSAYSANFPAPAEEYVNDFADVISSADADRIRTLLSRVESEAGVEITVVTINSLAEQEAGTSLSGYAAQLFDTWGVGDSRRNDGVMILFSKLDREVWIEAGLGYANRYNDAFQQVVDNDMLPYFRSGEYSRGLYEGAAGVTRVATKQISWLSYYKWPIILSALALVCVFAGISCIKSGKKGWGYVFFAVAGMLLLAVVKILAAGKGGKGGGFGGGRSGGGGAGGRW